MAVTQLLEKHRHPEHGYRACLGLLSLAKRYGKPRLEVACSVALQIGTCQYRHVRDILANKRDTNTQATTGDWISPLTPMCAVLAITNKTRFLSLNKERR